MLERLTCNFCASIWSIYDLTGDQVFNNVVGKMIRVIIYKFSFYRLNLDILLFQVPFTYVVHWDGVHANAQL